MAIKIYDYTNPDCIQTKYIRCYKAQDYYTIMVEFIDCINYVLPNDTMGGSGYVDCHDRRAYHDSVLAHNPVDTNDCNWLGDWDFILAQYGRRSVNIILKVFSLTKINVFWLKFRLRSFLRQSSFDNGATPFPVMTWQWTGHEPGTSGQIWLLLILLMHACVTQPWLLTLKVTLYLEKPHRQFHDIGSLKTYHCAN